MCIELALGPSIESSIDIGTIELWLGDILRRHSKVHTVRLMRHTVPTLNIVGSVFEVFGIGYRRFPFCIILKYRRHGFAPLSHVFAPLLHPPFA